MGSREILKLYAQKYNDWNFKSTPLAMHRFTHKAGTQLEHGISEARTIPCCWGCLSELATSNTWPILRQNVRREQRTRQNRVLNKTFVNSVLL